MGSAAERARRGGVTRTATRLGLALALAGGGAAGAETAHRPGLNLYGTTGLIDMPSALAQPDGQLSATVSNFAGQTRTTLSFQVLPRVSGSFRYSRIADWNAVVPGDFETYYDRSFDIAVQILTEGRWRPAVAVGLRDFLGTGLYSGEYVAATKHLGPVAVTGGLGWGRLGSAGDIGSPFGDRPPRDIGKGGDFEPDQYFKGPAAPFFGLEWRPADRWSLKAEYSSDAYDEEERRDLLERESDWNFGLEYRPADWLTVGAYSLYGTELGVAAQISFNLHDRPGGPGSEGAPIPIEPRPARTADPEAWATDWTEIPDVEAQVRAGLDKVLLAEGVALQGFRLEPTIARLWIRNLRYDVEAQALGRTARAATRLLPASVETIVLVPMTEDGMPAAQAVFNRSALEAFEVAPNGAERLRAATRIAPATALPAADERVPGLWPRLDFGLGPYARLSYFDPSQPLRYEIGAEATAAWRPAPGLVIEGSVTKRLLGTLDEADTDTDSDLPKVRTDWPSYAREGDPAIERLTAAYYFRPGRDLYGRVTAGYLERMYGGVSGELLWKPVDSRLGLGAELNYAVSRDFDGGLGFRDYDVVTGHLSAYYDIGGGFEAEVDAGRYLAGDWGATFSLDRTFGNGWKVGGFFTLTDVSAEEFGEGSFDKGIRVRIPISWFTNQPSPRGFGVTLRPVTRDGGARLNVPGRLYGQVRDWHADGLAPGWGRVWR